MFRKGFISTYLLYIFIILNSICCIILINTTRKFKSLQNLKIANKYLNQEIIVISFVKCQLINDELESGNYKISDIEFEIIYKKDEVEITILEKYSEKIILKIFDNKIIDYSSYTHNLFGV